MEQIILNLVPGGVSPVCYVSQYDVGRKIRLHLRNGSDPYVLSGAETVTATIRKVSGEELIYDIANTSASYVDLIVNYDATDVIGESVCELIITESGLRIGSANFKMRVDPDVYSGDQKLEVVTASSPNSLLSFETNIDENLLEFKAGLSPIQNGTPWIDSNVINKEPYIKRAVAGTATRIGNHLYDKLVGGTVAFNQLVRFENTAKQGLTATMDANNVVSVSGTATSAWSNITYPIEPIDNHKYFIGRTIIANPNNISLYWGFLNVNQTPRNPDLVSSGSSYNIVNVNSHTGSSTGIANIESGTDFTGFKFKLICIDLTAMFGSTIADYIYSLEQATAGAGVAWFKALFPNDYYAYDAGSLKSVKTSAHITRGFNQWDEEWVIENSRLTSKNYIPVVPSTLYFFLNTNLYDVYMYSADLNYIGHPSYGSRPGGFVFNTASNCHYIKFDVGTPYGNTYKHDICISISGDLDGQYQPYVSHNCPLDSDLELRGIPKLDENNNLYYDGDTYESNGDVTRKFNIVVLSSEMVTLVDDTYNQLRYARVTVPADALRTLQKMCISSKYGVGVNGYPFDNSNNIGKMVINAINSQLWFGFSKDVTLEQAQTAISDTSLIYELATPTTESADPFTDPQEIDPNGSEEFVDNRSVVIPVGHESYYANICPIEGWNETNVVRIGENLIPTIEPQTGSASNVTAIVGEDGVITLNGTSNANGSIILETNNDGIFAVPMIDNLYVRYFNDFENGSIALVFELNDGTNFGPSFNTINKIYKIPTESLGKVVWRIRIYFLSGQSFNNAKFSPMITIGNSETTYKKYDGVQTLNLDWNTNQWDEEWEQGGINGTTGANNSESGCIRSKNYIRVYPGQTLYFKAPSTWAAHSVRGRCYKADGTYLQALSFFDNTVVTIPSDCYYFRFVTPSGAEITTYNHDISINYPSTDHAYHPYRGHGAAYAGEVIYKDGGWKLKLLGTIADLGDLTWYPGACALENKKAMRSESIANIVLAPPSSSILVDILCSVYPTKTGDQTYLGTTGISILRGGTVAVFDERYSSADSVNAFKSAMTGVKLVYPLATPIEIPLDQNSKLATVLGINNLMHDANGGTEVKFFRLIAAS